MQSEKPRILTLFFLHFTTILDFVIMMPLGPQLMRVFELDASQFSWLVSSYTFSASFSGFLGAFFLDYFDRKKIMFTSYIGFIAGTFVCAVAPTYTVLVLARIIAGFFGGLVVSSMFSSIPDLTVPERRGRAMGVVMSAFSVASVLGLPLGLVLANLLSWHLPFMSLVVLSCICTYFIHKLIPEMSPTRSLSEFDFEHITKNFSKLLLDQNHIRAFILSFFVTLSAFMIIPFISPYLVSNVGLKESQLPLIYLVGGVFTFFTSRFSGLMIDRFGKLKVFMVMATVSCFAIFNLTHLPSTTLPLILFSTTFFMVSMSGRFVPTMSLVTASANPNTRTTFQSLTSAFQHLASGSAAVVGGMMIQTLEDKTLVGYGKVGSISVALTLFTLFLASQVKSRDGSR